MRFPAHLNKENRRAPRHVMSIRIESKIESKIKIKIKIKNQAPVSLQGSMR